MAKWIMVFAISILIAIVGAFFLVNSGILQARLQQELQTRCQCQAKLGPVRIPFQWPLSVRVGPTTITRGPISAEAQWLHVVIASFTAPYDIRVQLVKPKVTVQLEVTKMSEESGGAAPSAGAPSTRFVPPPLRLRVKILDGEFKANDISVQKLNLEFAQKLLMRSSAELLVSARVRTPWVPGDWPVTIDGNGLTFGEEVIKATSIKAWVADLHANIQGTSLLAEGRHRWLAEIQVPDLSKLPKPPFEIPASDWRGALHVQAELIKPDAATGWQANGRINASNVSANVNYRQEKTSVIGPVAVQLQSQFNYTDKGIAVPKVTGVVDLTQAQVESAGVLTKPAHVPLRFEVAAEGPGETLTLKKFDAHFWQLHANATGQLNLKAPYSANISFNLPLTALNGLETLIVPLKSSPVKGQLAAQADYAGPLTDPMAAKINLRSLQLNKFSADVAYEVQDSMRLRGPVSVNVDAAGELDAGKPKSFRASGQAELSGLSLVAGPFRKEARQKLAADFKLSTLGESLRIDHLNVAGFPGDVRLWGKIEQPTNPKVDVVIVARALNLSALRKALEEYNELIPNGNITGRLAVAGSMKQGSPWAEWPLNVSGQIKADLPEYHFAAAAPADKAAPAEPAPPQPLAQAGFLPKGPLTEKLNLAFEATIGLVQKDNLTAKGASLKGRVAQGRFNGEAQVKEIFGGQFRVQSLQVPLLEPNALIKGQVGFSQIVIQDFLDFVKPELKSMATGRSAGTISFSTRLPSAPTFMDELEANGKLNLNPVTFNTVKIGDLINELIAKIPGVDLPKAKVEPLKGKAAAGFSLSKQVITLSSLSAQDEGNSELDVKGTISLATMESDLKGNFHWANSPVKGCLAEGNADAKGRFVVPLALRGSMHQPKLSLVSDLAGKLAARALECEKNKLIEKAKKEGVKSLQKEAVKALKGIFGQ